MTLFAKKTNTRHYVMETPRCPGINDVNELQCSPLLWEFDTPGSGELLYTCTGADAEGGFIRWADRHNPDQGS